eukprot:33157-Prymnesium_polylepis.1
MTLGTVRSCSGVAGSGLWRSSWTTPSQLCWCDAVVITCDYYVRGTVARARGEVGPTRGIT